MDKMTIKDFVDEWNTVVSGENEDQEDDVLFEIKNMIELMMEENCGEKVPFRFINKKGKIELVQ